RRPRRSRRTSAIRRSRRRTSVLCATRSCSSSARTTGALTSFARAGVNWVTPSSSSAVTGSGTATSTPTMSVPRSKRASQPAPPDLLQAVAAWPADAVVVLPNNKNIVPVAEQLDALTTRRVEVVSTHAVVEGLAALVAYDGDVDADANARAMAEAAGRVHAG